MGMDPPLLVVWDTPAGLGATNTVMAPPNPVLQAGRLKHSRISGAAGGVIACTKEEHQLIIWQWWRLDRNGITHTFEIIVRPLSFRDD